MKTTSKGILLIVACVGLVVWATPGDAQPPKGYRLYRVADSGDGDVYAEPFDVEPPDVGPMEVETLPDEPENDLSYTDPGEAFPGHGFEECQDVGGCATEGQCYLGGPVCGGLDACGPCCAVCGGGSCCPDLWYITQEVRILGRSRPSQKTLAFTTELTETGFALVSQLDNRSTGFEPAAGYRGTIGRYLGRDADNRDQFVEFTFWGLNEWSGSDSVTGDRLNFGTEEEPVFAGDLFSPFDSDIGGFNRADSHSISGSSDINNYEFNLRLVPRGRGDRLVLHPTGRWRRECQPGWYCSWLVGLRVMSVNEDFRWHAEGVVDNDGVLGDVSGDYQIATSNDLFGFQIGADWTYRKCKWTYGVRGRGAPFVNFSEFSSRVFTNAADADPFVEEDLNYVRSKSQDHVAVAVELGFFTTYKIRPNLSLRASYDMLWVAGLSLAPEQFQFHPDPPNEFHADGNVFYQGLSLGMEWTW